MDKQRKQKITRTHNSSTNELLVVVTNANKITIRHSATQSSSSNTIKYFFPKITIKQTEQEWMGFLYNVTIAMKYVDERSTHNFRTNLFVVVLFKNERCRNVPTDRRFRIQLTGWNRRESRFCCSVLALRCHRFGPYSTHASSGWGGETLRVYLLGACCR